MLQRLPIALAQIKADNTSEYLLNEIRQIVYSLSEQRKLLKKYITVLWIQQRYNNKINTIFMNFEISKTSDPYRLSLNLTDKIDLRRKDKYIALSNLSIYIIHGKI